MPAESRVAGRVACFGVFEADFELGELRRQGRVVPLQDHSLQVLTALLEHAGREVSREDLRRCLWPDQEFVDFENGLNTAVARLRQALGDTADNPRFIVTRRGYGYRFIAPVDWVSVEPSQKAATSEDTPASAAAPPPAPPSAITRPGTAGVAAAVALSLVAVIIALNWSWKTAIHESPAASASAGADRIVIYGPGDETLTGSFALSPSGSRVAVVTAGDGPEQSRLWLRPLESIAARPLAGTEGAAMPFWSPNERAIGFFAQGKLKTIDLASGTVATRADAVRGRGATWNSDGRILFAPDLSSPIFAVADTGGRPTPATELGDAPSHRFPFFLPDGQRFVYLVLREDRDQSEIRWGRLGSPDGGRLLSAGSNAAYMAPGYLFFTRGKALLAQGFDAQHLTAAGLPVVVSDTAGVYGEGGPTGLGAFSVSAGETVAVADLPGPALHLAWFDRKGRPLDTIGPPGDYKTIELSPDAARAAVVRFDSRKRSSDLLIIDLRTGVPTQVTDDPWPDASPVWAPDGDRLAFRSLRDGRWRTFVRDSTPGDNERELPSMCWPESWFGDGKSLVCSTLGNPTELRKVPLDQVHPATALVRGLGYAQGRLSPNDAWLAYSSNHEGRRQIYLLSLGGNVASRPIAIAPGDSPRWRRDGRELFYLAGRTLMSVSLDFGKAVPVGTPQPLFEAPLQSRDSLADFLSSFGVSADGSKFLFATPIANAVRPTIQVVRHWSPTRTQ